MSIRGGVCGWAGKRAVSGCRDSEESLGVFVNGDFGWGGRGGFWRFGVPVKLANLVE